MGRSKRRRSTKIFKTKPKVPPSREAGTAQMERKALLAPSGEMKKIDNVVRATPELRTERINEIKKLIEENRYQVKSSAIAKKMVTDFLFELEKE